nr:universal stress protein [Hymenolepis microstoma]
MLKNLQCISLDFANRSVDSLNLLQGFSRSEMCLRNEWAQSVQRVIVSWYFGFGSPAVAGFLESYSQDSNGTTVDTSMHHNILCQIPDLARVILTCPLADVRQFCQAILEDLRTKKHFIFEIPFQPSPSFALSENDLPHLRCIFEEPFEDDPLFTTYALFCAYWYRWGRLDNFAQILGCHPEFLEPFMAVHQWLFTGDLALPYPARYYLAILAAAEMRCPQLVCLFVRYFLQAGGDPTWTLGLSSGPSRWLQLKELNCNLAHSPWKVTADDIYQLTRGDIGANRGDKLSLSELMHAVGIMTHVHALACFIFGAGVRPELEHICPSPYHPCVYSTATSANTNTTPATFPLDESGDKSTTLADEPEYKDRQAKASEMLFNLLKSEPEDESDSRSDEVLPVPGEIFQSSYAKSLVDLKLSNYFEKVTLPDGFTLEGLPVLSKFISYPDVTFQDYMGPPFLLAEFSWMEEGSPLVDHLASTLGSLFDEAFKNAFELTYNTLNDYFEVNTTSLRHSLWFFVQSVFGACHEDMRIERVLKLLTPEQRCYLKFCASRPFDLVAYPSTMGREMFAALSPYEVVHVHIMIMEARKQTCLSYALRAISQCQTRR